MKNIKSFSSVLVALTVLLLMVLTGCNQSTQQKSDSGVTKASVTLQTDANGHTIEQNNLADKYKDDNKPGALKYLYIISAYTGDVLETHIVKGKITSTGKRLSPTTVNSAAGIGGTYDVMTVILSGHSYVTDEVPDENGTYGSSTPGLFWFDVNGVQQQYYPTGGTYLRISGAPLRVNKTKLTFQLEEE